VPRDEEAYRFGVFVVARELWKQQYPGARSRGVWTCYLRALWGNDATAPTRLVQVDMLTNKPTRILDFPGVTLLNMLAPWKP